MPSEKTQVDQITIKVAGTFLAQNIMDALIDVEVDSSMGVPDMFIMRFHDDDLAIMNDSSKFAAGALVEISMIKSVQGANGAAPAATLITKGEITAVEPEFHQNTTATLTIRGFDKSHRLIRGTKTRVFVDMTHSDIVSKIAGENGLSAVVDSTTTAYKHVFQDNQTDRAFLEDLARQNGYKLYYADDKLNFKKFATAGTTVELEWGVTLRSFSPRLSLARQVNEVKVKGWDVKAKQAIVGTATTSSTQPQVGVGQSGGQLLQSAIAAASYTEVRQAVTSQGEATAIAKALLDQINTEFIEAEGIAFGNPDIKAGITLKFKNLGARFSGSYRITSATHRYSAQDTYDTYFKVEGATPHLIADYVTHSSGNPQKHSWVGVYPAVVTGNKDEQDNLHYGLVKVKFPWLDDQLESYWARVISMGAGANRGVLWLPEVNDEVMVIFEHGDFNRPYVIGGVWNGLDAPPEPLANVAINGKIEVRTIKTRAGHIVRFSDEAGKEKIEIIDCKTKNKITLDTENEVMTLITSDKTKLVLDGKNEKVTLESSKDTDVTSKGAGAINVTNQTGAITIKSSSGNIDLQTNGTINIKGTTINIEATANVTVKGNAGATVQSAAATMVKGNPLLLN
jgi:phage protein D/phage baseplate assembly protein gpV